MTTLQLQKLQDYLEILVNQKGAYEVGDEGAIDDICNDFSFECYRVSDGDLDDAVICDWSDLLIEVFGIEFNIDVIENTMYINNYPYKLNISNYDDLRDVLIDIAGRFNNVFNVKDDMVQNIAIVCMYRAKKGVTDRYDIEDILLQASEIVRLFNGQSKYAYIGEYLQGENPLFIV